MDKKWQNLKWKLHNYKSKKLLLWGLKHGLIAPYNDELIEKLRTIYDGGIPASVLLLSDGMSNGHCYDRALLMAKAFLDEKGDVQLIYASIDSLKLNHEFIDDSNPLYADHCIVEVTSESNKHFIIDTSAGFVYDKNLYWIMENPKVRKIQNKDSIIKFIQEEEYYHPEDIERDKYVLPLILPMIELTYGRPNEMYSMLGIELLQREIEYLKKVINYDDICQEIDEDMKALGFKK